MEENQAKFYSYTYSSVSQTHNGNNITKQRIYVNNNGQGDNYYREYSAMGNQRQIIREEGNRDLLTYQPNLFKWSPFRLLEN